MARIPFVVTVAVVFFSFTLSHARIPANIPGGDVNSGELPDSFSRSDVIDPLIRLPSVAESHSIEPIRETEEPQQPLTVQSVPLRVVRFRPADHHLGLRSRFPYRCRHHRHHYHLFMPIKQHQEISYGDDMLMSSGENADFGPGMFHGGVRRIPARWVKIPRRHHHDDQDEDDGVLKHGDTFDNKKFKKHQHHHRHDHDKNEDKEEMFKDHHKRKEASGGFIKRIRKILDLF